MNKKPTLKRFTKETLPPDQSDWARVKAMKDKDIDFSDSPALTPEQLARAVVRRGVRVKPNKLMLNLRVDADVLAWWRARGQGYQSEINAVLRAVMEEHLKCTG